LSSQFKIAAEMISIKLIQLTNHRKLDSCQPPVSSPQQRSQRPNQQQKRQVTELGFGGPRRCWVAVPPGNLDGFGGLGEDLRKPPTDASPSAEIEFTLSKKWFSRRSHLPMPRPGGVASKSELFGNRSVPQRRVRVARKCSGDLPSRS
jgi:hypothetical protein